jgi:hypothetical protein
LFRRGDPGEVEEAIKSHVLRQAENVIRIRSGRAGSSATNDGHRASGQPEDNGT